MTSQPAPARSQLRQLYALAYAIRRRRNKRPVAQAWFAAARAMLTKGPAR